MKTEKRILVIAALGVALFTALFVILLVTTFNMDPWEGEAHYANMFQPSYIYTVYPSILLAISFMIFNVGVYHYASSEKKIWARLAMNFGIVYATLSLANYFIQLITVAPSIETNHWEGLGILMTGHPHTIFMALMASYFLMCVSYFFTAFVFQDKWIRIFLMISSVGCILIFALGTVISVQIIMPIGALCWIIGSIIGTFLIACKIAKEK